MNGAGAAVDAWTLLECYHETQFHQSFAVQAVTDPEFLHMR